MHIPKKSKNFEAKVDVQKSPLPLSFVTFWAWTQIRQRAYEKLPMRGEGN